MMNLREPLPELAIQGLEVEPATRHLADQSSLRMRSAGSLKLGPAQIFFTGATAQENIGCQL